MLAAQPAGVLCSDAYPAQAEGLVTGSSATQLAAV